MRINADLTTSIFTAILAIIAYSVTRDLSHLGVVFVNYTLVLMALLSLIVFIKSFLKPQHITFFESAIERNNTLAGIGILFIYLIFLPFVGFLPASYIFYFAFNTFLADKDRFSTRNLVQSAIITIIVVTAFYFIFHDFLGVPLPEGSWFGAD